MWRSLSVDPKGNLTVGVNYNGSVKRILFIFFCALGVIGLVGGLWSLVLPGRISMAEDFPENLRSLYGQNQLKINRPAFLRLGEPAPLVLHIQPLAGGQEGALPKSGNEIVYQSRLVAPGVGILPEELTAASYDPSDGVIFSWVLTPQRAGTFEGTLRIYVSGEPQPKPGEAGELIFAIPLTFVAHTVMGLDLDVFRALCLLLLAGGGMAAMLVYFNSLHEKKLPINS